MSIESIKNYLDVSDRIASSGQPDEVQFRDISQAGYDVVINLAMPNSGDAIPEEGNIVTALQMMYVHIPVPFDAPEIKHLRSFLGIMDALSDKKIWIHCVLNYRVSAFLYQYWRLVKGMEDVDASKVMLSSWAPNSTWKEFMKIELEDVGL